MQGDRVTRESKQRQMVSDPMTRRLAGPDAACRDCKCKSGNLTRKQERGMIVWEPCCFGVGFGIWLWPFC